MFVNCKTEIKLEIKTYLFCSWICWGTKWNESCSTKQDDVCVGTLSVNFAMLSFMWFVLHFTVGVTRLLLLSRVSLSILISGTVISAWERGRGRKDSAWQACHYSLPSIQVANKVINNSETRDDNNNCMTATAKCGSVVHLWLHEMSREPQCHVMAVGTEVWTHEMSSVVGNKAHKIKHCEICGQSMESANRNIFFASYNNFHFSSLVSRFKNRTGKC